MSEISYLSKKIQGIDTFYRQLGSFSAKKKILLLHGWTMQGAKNWEIFLQDLYFSQSKLHQECLILAPDMPGFGSSTEPIKVWTAMEYAEFVVDFLQSFALENSLSEDFLQDWLIIGHSFGGAVATTVACKHSDLVKHLVLAAPAIVRTESTVKQKTLQKVSKFGKKVINSFGLDFIYQKLRKIWYRLIGSPDFHKTKGIMSEIMQIVIRQDLQFLLKDVLCPVDLVWGDKDKYTPYSQAKIIQNQLKNCHLTTLNGINHGIHLHSYVRLVEIVAGID